MPQSLSKVYVHITFSTKNRHPFLDRMIKNRLWDYIGGICKEMIGGIFGSTSTVQ